jgi:Rgg/GadR/MutR family transcriptional activator
MIESGSYIEEIRKQKGISIKDLCGTRISRSSYNRFVNGKQDTSSTNFLYLLSELNITYDEFSFYSLSDEYQEFNALSVEIRKAFEEKNINELLIIKDTCKRLYVKNGLRFSHLSSMCSLLIDRLEEKSLDYNNYVISQYLINLGTWTRYELILFNNCMYVFNMDFIKIILKKAVSSIRKYSAKNRYGDEGFRMIINAIVHFLINDEVDLSYKYFKMLVDSSLPEDCIYERLLLNFFNGIFNLLKGKNLEGEATCNQALSILKFLDCDNLYTMHKNLFDFLKNKYQWA